MNKAYRALIPVLVLLLAAAGASATQAATLVEHNAQPLGLTPNAGSPPEFGRCIKVTSGEYENAACTKTSGSSKHYEWYPAFGSAQPLEKTSFTTAIKESTSSVLETVSGTQVVCSGETSVGKYASNHTVGNVVITFTGCVAFGLSCTSEGAAGGTIVTHTLEGVLGVESLGAEASENGIGEELHPPGGGTVIASFNCGGMPVTISHALIGQVASNSMKASDTVKFKQSGGKQQPLNFVGEPSAALSLRLEENTPEQAGESLTTIQTNEEKLEINSVV
ncbi:MAG TPA: hypothetical protein VK707_10275 [Solirubrobacteraceae bacterium]|jgi:hypothetical protein|nr:hypothetical protein [Solirubrobacteraceae bacterium]